MLQHCCHRERRSRTERLFLYHNIYLHSMVFLSNEFSNSVKSKLLSMYPCRICFKLRLLPYATYNFPILFSNLPVVPVGQHFLLSCSTSHSGSFFKWCHKMKPACFEFVSIKSKAVSEDVSHNCNFLFWCVSIH